MNKVKTIKINDYNHLVENLKNVDQWIWTHDRWK